MINLPIIQSLWIGSELSRMENLSLTSYIQNGHPVHLYSYDAVGNVPDGVQIKDANTIIERDKIFKYTGHDSYAGFANLFRYKLLLTEGNFWSDLDVICLKPIVSSDEFVFASERAKDGRLVVNNCLIGVPRNSRIIEYCYVEANSKDSSKLVWGETGPTLLTRAVYSFKLHDYVLAPEVISKVDWWNVDHFISKSFSDIIDEDVYAIHLFNECWRRNKIDKNAKHKPDSLYESLFDKYSQ